MKGFVCWKRESVRDIIDPLALNIEPAFLLATHTPFKRLDTAREEEKGIHERNEESLLESIIDSFEKRSCFTVIAGPPGTGKSNLIWWVSYNLKRRLQNTKVILIPRSDATLARAIKNLISELGKEFEDLAKDFSRAISNLTTEGQCLRLLNLLGESINPKATYEDLNLPAELLRLRPWEFLNQEYVREVLCGENGVTSKVIERLVYRGRDFEGLVNFRPDDLILPDRSQIERMSKSARFLAVRLRQDSEIRQKMAVALNNCLNLAIKSLMDLTPHQIYNAFDEIRARLAAKGNKLALLIEDVSTFQGVDRELINYFSEPKKDPKLCLLFSMIGITDGDYEEIFVKENIIQRISHLVILKVGKGTGLFLDQENLANFCGHYLNAVRLGSKELNKWYSSLDGKSNIGLPNFCTDCKYQLECHQTFGASEEGFGLYPFTQQSLWRCLESLEHLFRTPRHVLTRILKPVLRDAYDQIPEQRFPPNPLTDDIERPHFETSTQIVENFLNQKIHPSNDRKREHYKSLLAYYGNGKIDITLDDSRRRQIGGIPEKIFEIFDLPLVIDSDVDRISEKEHLGKKGEVVEKEKEEVEEKGKREESREYSIRLRNLQDWFQGKSLENDRWYRQRIRNALMEFIDLESNGFSEYEFERIITEATIVIKDQITKPLAGDKIIIFERNPTTLNALEALLRFQYKGNNSWKFDGGMEDQREFIRFLREGEVQLLNFLKATYNNDLNIREILLQVSSEFLVWGAQIVGIFNLKTAPGEVIKQISKFEFKNEGRPSHLGEKYCLIWEEVGNNFKGIRQLLFDVLNKRRSGGTQKFIDSSVIQNALSGQKSIDLKTLPEIDISNFRANDIWHQVPSIIKKLRELPELMDEAANKVNSDYKEIVVLLNRDTPAEYSSNLENIYKLAKELNIAGPSCDGYRDARIRKFNSKDLEELKNKTEQLEKAQVLAEKIDFLLYHYPRQLNNILEFVRTGNRMLRYLEDQAKAIGGDGDITIRIAGIEENIRKKERSIDVLLNECFEVIDGASQKK